MCARSMHVAAGALGAAWAQASGHEVAFDFGTVGAHQSRLDQGAVADLVILSAPAIDRLERTGALVSGSRRAVAKTFIALCVRAGAARPDFATAETFRRLLESSRAVACSDPAVGGSAGVHLAKVFEEEGLAALMRSRGLPQPTGAEVARRVVEGKAEFGLTLSGEIAGVEGAEIAGPLPPPFGQDTHYVAAVMAASAAQDAATALIAALTRPQAAATWSKAGFQQP
jgi:molybdate transport system substrate-binding protein